MDWNRKDASMPSQDINLFKYDGKPNETRVLKLQLKGGIPANGVDQNPACDQDWSDVLQKERSAQLDGSNSNGLFTIISPRQEPARDFEFHNTEVLRSLPWTRSTWQSIRDVLSVHGSIAPVISRSYAAEFSSTSVTINSNPAIVINCRSSAKWKGDLALSVTYFPERNFSYSIFYGCSKDIQTHVASRLKNSEDALAHPMLLPGIFAEEERLRQRVLVRDKLLSLTKRTSNLNKQRFNWAHMDDMDAEDGQRNGSVDIWLETYELKSGLENWRELLDKMIAQCDVLQALFQPLATVSTMVQSGERIKERLQDIAREYNEQIRRCEMIMEGMTLATQMAHTRANMEIAVRTKADSSQMRSIALLTMIFLPATFAATLFSMGFFEWQPEKGQRVVSSRIWIYFVVAGALTLLTVGLYYLLVVRRQRGKHKDDEEKVSYDEFDD